MKIHVISSLSSQSTIGLTVEFLVWFGYGKTNQLTIFQLCLDRDDASMVLKAKRVLLKNREVRTVELINCSNCFRLIYTYEAPNALKLVPDAAANYT